MRRPFLVVVELVVSGGVGMDEGTSKHEEEKETKEGKPKPRDIS